MPGRALVLILLFFGVAACTQSPEPAPQPAGSISLPALSRFNLARIATVSFQKYGFELKQVAPDGTMLFERKPGGRQDTLWGTTGEKILRVAFQLQPLSNGYRGSLLAGFYRATGDGFAPLRGKVPATPLNQILKDISAAAVAENSPPAT